MPRLFMFVVIVFVYIVVAQNILFLEILSVIWTKKNIGKISTHTPFPILIYRTWKIKSPQKNFNTITFFENQNLSKKIFLAKWDQKKKKKNKAQKINPWEFCAHPKKWATNKNIRVVQFLLQGFLLFWKYKRTNHKRNYLKKLTKNYYEELSKIME